MQYQFGKPISVLLSEYLKRYTTDKDCEALREKYNCEKSKSLINQIRLGCAALIEENAKYVDDLFAIAVKNDYQERKKFSPLLKQRKALQNEQTTANTVL